MKLLEERIRKDGTVKAGNVLKVDSFLNHQMDIDLFNEMGKEYEDSDCGGFRYRYRLCGSPAFSCACGICKKVPVRKY